MSADNFLEVDKAAYITFEAAMQTLDVEVKKQIQSIKTISTSKDTSVAPKGINFNKSGIKGIFMGVYENQIHYGNTINSFKLAINEISEKGDVGEKFFLTLHSKVAEEWQNNATVKLFTKKIGKAIIVFQNIPYQVKSQNIEFHLMVPSSTCPWMKVKHYFSSFTDAKSEQYVYTSLYDTAKNMAITKNPKMKCNLYAVIHSQIHEPKESRQGKGHGMFVVVDPSCYEDMVKQRDYCVHVFTSSLSAFPKIETGDIIRLHRGWAEIRPRDGLTDFRVFREDDLVIFPWNDEERPRCSASRFTVTKEDVELVKNLKKWSLERYRKPVETIHANIEATDKNPITLSEIKLRENFNLSCRVVDFFEEECGVAIWVEDGTRCPLFTVSDTNIGPYDSQQTQDINSDCLRICIRCSKVLLGTLTIKRQMLLYLREVVPVIDSFPSITVVQFEIVGAIELLPLNTRYHKSLIQRLAKAKGSVVNVELNILPAEKMDIQIETQQLPERQQADLQPTRREGALLREGLLDKEPTAITVEKDANLVPQQLQIEKVVFEISEDKISSQKDIISCGACSTDRAMKDIPSDFFDPVPPSVQQLVHKFFELAQRLHRLNHPELGEAHLDDSELISPFKSQNLASFEDMHFSQAVASTQKPFEISEDKISSQKDIISSGECSTDRAMKDIPSDVFDPVSPPLPQLAGEDFEWESQRLHRLNHPELGEAHLDDSELISPFKSQNLASFEDMHFSQAVASTQKPPRCEVGESNDADHSSISLSQEITNAQRILSPAESEAGASKSELASPSDSPVIDYQLGRRSRSTSRSLSPHPAFRAVNEVLEIKTNFRSKTNDLSELENENQLNISIDTPLFRSRLGKGDQITRKTKETQSKRVVERVTFGDGDLEEIFLIASKSEEHKSTVKKRNCNIVKEQTISKIRRVSSESSNSDIVEIEPDDLCQEMDQESDEESIIILDPSSQLDLEKIFCAVEEAQPAKKYLHHLEEKYTVQPGERFRITARISELLPEPHFPSIDDPVGLKSMLVAFCLECKHLWQYNQFIDSVSDRVMQRRTLPPTSTIQDDGSDYIVVNYLCSMEEHTRNMRLLVEGTPNIDDYEYDENVLLDRSYHYICPFCDSRKIPHSLCTLKPSFFLRMHVTEKSIANADSESPTECLHILATGVHAEYFLGTKADHVLRSQVVWKRAEQRIAKLVESKQPLTLGLIRRESNPNEICLEFTKTVFASNHLLPWR